MSLKISSGNTYVDTAEALVRLTEALHRAVRAGLDTEADSLHHYFEKVCLIQISFSGKNYIVDPLAGFSLSEFFEVLAHKELILHGADYDLRMLKKSFGFFPKAPVFETMLAAQVLGYEQIGLAALVEKFYGVLLPKAGQKADWSRRPLSAELLDYASGDTKYLESMAGILTESLAQVGRVEWHRECCERVVKMTGLPEKNETKDVWRIKGSSRLLPNELVFVRELWKWRDGEARQKDYPPYRIMRNEDLIELAQWRVKNSKEPLNQGPSFLKRFAGEIRERLENAIRLAQNMPSAQWPLPQERHAWSPADQFDRKKVEPLIASCKELAEELKIQPCFLASRAVLTALVQYQAQSVERMMEVSGMMRWQAELIMPAVKNLLGKS